MMRATLGRAAARRGSLKKQASSKRQSRLSKHEPSGGISRGAREGLGIGDGLTDAADDGDGDGGATHCPATQLRPVARSMASKQFPERVVLRCSVDPAHILLPHNILPLVNLHIFSRDR